MHGYQRNIPKTLVEIEGGQCLFCRQLSVLWFVVFVLILGRGGSMVDLQGHVSFSKVIQLHMYMHYSYLGSFPT